MTGKPTAATAAGAAHLIYYCSNAQLTRKRRSVSHNTNFALQFDTDLAPLPPDHLGEPDTPCAVGAFKFGLHHPLC